MITVQIYCRCVSHVRRHESYYSPCPLNGWRFVLGLICEAWIFGDLINAGTGTWRMEVQLRRRSMGSAAAGFPPASVSTLEHVDPSLHPYSIRHFVMSNLSAGMEKEISVTSWAIVATGAAGKGPPRRSIFFKLTSSGESNSFFMLTLIFFILSKSFRWFFIYAFLFFIFPSFPFFICIR